MALGKEVQFIVELSFQLQKKRKTNQKKAERDITTDHALSIGKILPKE